MCEAPTAGDCLELTKQPLRSYRRRLGDWRIFFDLYPGRSHAAPWKGTQPTWAWCQRVVLLDGEIVCLDHDGRPLFNALLYCRAEPCFVAFDCLSRGGSPPSRTATTSASAQVPALPCRSFVGSHALHSSCAGANRALNGATPVKRSRLCLR